MFKIKTVYNIIMLGSLKLKEKFIWVTNLTKTKTRLTNSCLICGDVFIMASLIAFAHSLSFPKSPRLLQASWNVGYKIPKTFPKSSKLHARLTWLKSNLREYNSLVIGWTYVRQLRLKPYILMDHCFCLESPTNLCGKSI